MERQPSTGENKPLYERQLDEILQGAGLDDESPRSPLPVVRLPTVARRVNNPGRAAANRASQATSGIPYNRLILGALGLAVLGMVVQSVVPTLGGLMIVGAVVLLLAPLVISLFRPGSRGSTTASGEEKLWRGRPVVYDNDDRPPFEEVIRRFRPKR